MKYLKFILINVIVFGIFLFLLSLLFPGTITTGKTITVLADKEKVNKTLQSLNDWGQWNEFSKADNISVKILFSNSDTLATIWQQKSGRTLLSYHNLISNNKNSTIINWVLQEKIKWYQPLKKFSALFMDKNISRAMESSLTNLKKIIELPPGPINQEN